MTVSHVEKLPIGLITDLAKLLPFEDAKSLSRVSRLMRDAVVRLLFGTLSITCPAPPDRDLDPHINKYKGFISRLHFNINLEPNPDDYDSEDEEFGHAPSIWGAGTSSTDTIKRIIRGEALSHIDTISVKFEVDQFDDDGWSHDLPSIFVFEHPEDLETVRRQEQEFFWRAQYTEVWNEVAANPNIKSFKIFNLLPKTSSVWYTDEWKTFLGRLEDLDMSIFGCESAGWRATKMSGFMSFGEELSTLMLQHASNLTRLRVEAHKDGLLGRCYMNNVPLPFEGAELPALRVLELECIMVSSGLLDFLRSRAKNLQEIKFHECMCSCEGDDIRWADLWKLIREDITSINTVSYSQSKTSSLEDEEQWDSDETNPDSEAVAKFRKLLEENNGLMRWRYVTVDDKYAMVFEQPESNVAYFEEGSDQLEYTKLLEELEKRRKKGSMKIP